MISLARSVSMLAVVMVGFNAFAAFSEIGLQGVIGDVRSAYSWSCTGHQACNAMWDEQVRAINSLNDYVDTRLPDGVQLSKETGNIAKEVTQIICRSEAYGPYQKLVWLVSAENRGINRLATLQKLAEVPVYRCTKQVR